MIRFWPAMLICFTESLFFWFLESAFPFFVSPSTHKVLVSSGESSTEFVFWPCPVTINTTPEVSVLKSEMLNKCVTLFQGSHSRSQTKHTRSHIVFTFWHAHLHSRSERAKVQHRLSLKCSSDHRCLCWLPPMICWTELGRLLNFRRFCPRKRARHESVRQWQLIQIQTDVKGL